MLHINKVILGILNFIESAVAPQLPSMSHIGAVWSVNIMKEKIDYISSHIAEHMKHNQFISMLGLIEENNEVDFCTLEKSLLAVVDKQGFIELKGQHLSTLLSNKTNLFFLEGLKLDKKGMLLLMQHIKEA